MTHSSSQTDGGAPVVNAPGTASRASNYVLPAIIAGVALVVIVGLVVYFKAIVPGRRRKPLVEALGIVERDERASFETAEELLSSALVSGLKGEDVATARFALAWIRAQTGRFAEASGVVADLISSGDKSPETIYLDLWLAAKLEDHEHVETSYETYSTGLGDLLDTRLIASIAFLALARARWSRRQIDGARHYFQVVRDLGVLADRVPAGVDDHEVMLGVLALLEKNVEQATHHFSGSIEAAQAAGQPSTLGDLGLLLCEWRDDDNADIDERLAQLAEALTPTVGDPAESEAEGEDRELSDEQLLLRGVRLWRAVALVTSWRKHTADSGLADDDRAELERRLEQVKEIDPGMGDPYLMAGLVGYYFARGDEERRAAVAWLEEAIERDVSLPEAVSLLQRERRLDQLAVDAVESFLKLAGVYIGDAGIPEKLRHRLRERLGRHAEFGGLSDLEIERSQTDTIAVLETVRLRSEQMEARVRTILGARVRDLADADKLGEVLTGLREQTEALTAAAKSVDETGIELLCMTGEFLLSEEETLPENDPNEGGGHEPIARGQTRAARTP